MNAFETIFVQNLINKKKTHSYACLLVAKLPSVNYAFWEGRQQKLFIIKMCLYFYIFSLIRRNDLFKKQPALSKLLLAINFSVSMKISNEKDVCKRIRTLTLPHPYLGPLLPGLRLGKTLGVYDVPDSEGSAGCAGRSSYYLGDQPNI